MGYLILDAPRAPGVSRGSGAQGRAFTASGVFGDVPRISGAASAEGTRRFVSRATESKGIPASHFRTAPGELRLSTLGLGTYIGPPDAVTDRMVEETAEACVASGRVNVLDTAINYRYQRAERSVGRALAHLIDRSAVARDEVFVSTKNGYLAPDAEARVPADRWIEQELVAKEVLDPADIVDDCHAMSRSYLQDQLERSRGNLGLGTIDLLYLHNAPDAQLPVVGPEEFSRRLLDAFRLYEEFRSRGKVVAYGLATWECLRVKKGSPGYYSLEAAVNVAREAGGEHHGFRFIQFPFNLGMPEAAVVRNQTVRNEKMTLFEAASKLGIGCFTSVPLLQGQLARVGPAANGFTAAQTAIQFARSAPGNLGPLVGQKDPRHVAENLELARRSPWDAREFGMYLA
jgi:aryl-alcohol dehydrogenase-like predicted oxidoreductase